MKLQISNNVFAVALLVAIPAVSAQQVLVVDETGAPGTLPTLAAAVVAAAPGDTILVRPGTYAGTTIDKPVDIVSDVAGFGLHGVLEIADIPAGATVRVRGVRHGSSDVRADFGRIRARNCAGTVWLEDCDLSGVFIATAAQPLIACESCDAFVLTRSKLQHFALFWSPEAYGLVLDDSNAYLSECEIEGGRGGSLSQPLAGWPAVRVVDSEVFVQGSTLRGGAGGGGSGCVVNGDGGPAMLVEGAASRVTYRDSNLIGGDHGDRVCGRTAPPAASLRVLAGVVIAIPGEALTMTAPFVARELDPIVYEFRAEPGSLVALSFALAPAPLYFAPFELPLLLGASFVSIPVGAVPATGSLTVPTTAPDLGLGVDLQRYFVQAIGIDPHANLLGGSAQGVTTLDAAF